MRIIVTGRVQGVGFRVATQRQASRLGLGGWVRNASDGSVEIHAEGAEEALDELLTWCHVGPSAARVEDVRVMDAPPEDFMEFARR